MNISCTTFPAKYDYEYIMTNTMPNYKTNNITLTLSIKIDMEEDGRWIAEIPEIPGVLAYGETVQDAIETAKELVDFHIEDEQKYHERPEGIYNINYVIS